MEILGIDHVVFTVGDISKAVKFYLRLGLKLQFQSEQTGAAVMSISAEHPNLLLLKAKEEIVKGGLERPRLWIEVKDAQTATEELRANGFQFAREPFLIPTGWLVEVVDPWGNIIGFNDYHLQPQFGRLSAVPHRKDPVS